MLKTKAQKSQPVGATAFHRAHVKLYVKMNLQIHAICKLCWRASLLLDNLDVLLLIWRGIDEAVCSFMW